MTANELTQAILAVLNSTPGCFAWRQNNHATRRRRNNVKVSVTDILGCYRGQLLAIEVKVASDRMSDKQKDFQAKVVACGGLHIEAKTLDGFLEWWKEKNRERKTPPAH